MPNPNILFQNMPGPSLSENFESALGTQQKLNEFRNMPMKNRLLQNEVAASDINLQQAQKQVGLQEQDQQRKQYLQQIGDMAVDAVGLLPLIESGDVGQITTALDKRIEKIRARGGDPSDTMDFRDRLLSGQINKDQAVQELNGVVSAAERMGVIKPAQAKGGLTEYQTEYLKIQKEKLNKPSKAEGATANERDWKKYTELKKTDPEGAQLFGKQVGIVDDERKLSAAAEKVLNEATQAYFDTSKQAREYDVLANDFKQYTSELPAGTAATVSEFLKSVTGSQDEATELRRRLAKVRLSEALKYLPPGPATDRDVEEAYKGVPKENAGVEQVEMFLRGSSKMAAIDAEFQEFKANYISENNSAAGLIPAWKQKIADGGVESINALGNGKTSEQTGAVKFLGFE